jgi:hypothetical protein
LNSMQTTDHQASSHELKLIIIGGIPEPIGGVTTYLRRLLHRDSAQIEWLLDFYPGTKEPVRGDCQGKVIPLGGKVALLRWLWTNRSAQVGREVFFNFSTPRALVLTLFAPKVKGTRWSLMLHHGSLTAGGGLRRRAIRWALSRFDEVKSLSEPQTAFYRAAGVEPGRVVAGSSYCEPADHVDDPDALAELARIRGRYGKVVVMSGFPKPLYNFQLGIDAVAAMNKSESDCALSLFIYGPGELRARIRQFSVEYPWLFVFDGKTERYFNTFLRQCDLLMRLTATESFGISVWDADHWERNILASDVCRRPAKTIPINLYSCSLERLKELIAAELRG